MGKDVLRQHQVSVSGEGQRVIVLAHGFGCDQSVWHDVAADLARDHRVVLFDYLGCGKSDRAAWRADRYAHLEDYARDVLAIIDALGLSKVVYIGHSISSSIGVLAAVARPERFERLIMIAPNPCFINEPPDYVGGYERADIQELLDLMERNMIGWANFFAPVAMKNADRPELAEDLRRRLSTGDPVVLKQFAKVVFGADVRSQLPALRVPTLIMQCSDDAVAPAAVGGYMAQHIPSATLTHMKATGHCPHMSYPEETIAVIREYLSAMPA